ncbi:MAG: thioredoxin family protein, partial [Caulobacteraceae bacterium]
VLSVQAGSNALAALMAAGVSLALAGWLFGVFQRGHGGYAAPAMAGLAALAAVGLAAGGARTAVAGPTAAGKASALPSQPWSPERVAVLRAEGKPVFVNFTAAWCVTCQVNEQVAFSTRPVADAFAKTGAVYLKADWTRRDPVIARALAEHGRAGVPLYLVYGKNPAAPPQVLPQLLTGGAVVAAINRAAA